MANTLKPIYTRVRIMSEEGAAVFDTDPDKPADVRGARPIYGLQNALNAVATLLRSVLPGDAVGFNPEYVCGITKSIRASMVNGYVMRRFNYVRSDKPFTIIMELDWPGGVRPASYAQREADLNGEGSIVDPPPQRPHILPVHMIPHPQQWQRDTWDEYNAKLAEWQARNPGRTP